MSTQITSTSGMFRQSDLGKPVTIGGNRRLVWPWWAMFARWEVEERPIVCVKDPTSATLGQPRWSRRPLDWQR